MNDSDKTTLVNKINFYIIIPILVTVVAGVVLLYIENNFFQPKPITQPTNNIAITPTTTSNPANEVLVLSHRPTLQEYKETANIWDLFKHKDLTKPNTLVYEVSINSNNKYRWGSVWCGKDRDTLAEILQPLSMELWVDGSLLPDENILQFDEVENGWYCHRWSTILSDWKSGSVVELELKYSLTKRIYDGKIYVEKGNYQLVIEVKVD